MNGLQSLVPPPPQLREQARPRPAPTQNDPRMAAAMNVVKNDVPEPLQNLVSESEFAQKAMELLQSAGGQAAMGQAPVNPPTVKQAVDQQAMEGVAGLLSRLAPGMQQRGKQVQRAQARKMLGGGMPAMRAPNMQRMADGGIVGYADGGQPMMGPPEPNLLQRMGQGLKNIGGNVAESSDILREAKAGIGVPYENRAAAIQQVRDEIKAQKQNRDPNFIQRMGQKLMDMGLDVQESNRILKEAYSNIGKTYEEKAKGMAMGGEVKSYQEGTEVELDPELAAIARAMETGGAETRSGLEGSQETAAFLKNLFSPTEEQRRREKRRAEREALAKAGVGVPEINAALERRDQQRAGRAAVGVNRPIDLGGVAGLLKSRTSSAIPPRLIDDAPVGTAEGGQGDVQSSTDTPTTQERMGGSIDELIRMINQPQDTTRPEIDSRLEGLREPTIAAVTERMTPGYEEGVRSRIQQEAEKAYAVPQEYRDLIEGRVKELDTPLYTPEEAKSRKIDELLMGLASSNMIAQGGPRATRGINAVTDAIKKDSLDRAGKKFELSSGLLGKDMEASRQAFGEGLGVLKTAMNQVSVATQMAGSLLNQADNAAAADALQKRQERLSTITSTISALGVIGQLERADLNALSSSQRAATTELSTIQREIGDLTNTLSFTPEENRAPIQAQLDALRTQESAARRIIQAVNSRLNLETDGGSGAASSTAVGIPAADYFK